MGSVDRADDDRTFRVNLTGDSVIKLRDSVGEKLKEFMGDYTDDTLVVRTLIIWLLAPCLLKFTPNFKCSHWVLDNLLGLIFCFCLGDSTLL